MKAAPSRIADSRSEAGHRGLNQLAARAEGLLRIRSTSLLPFSAARAAAVRRHLFFPSFISIGVRESEQARSAKRTCTVKRSDA